MRVLLMVAGCVGWLLIFAGALQFFAVLPEMTKPAIVVVPQLILAAISGTSGWLIVAVTAAGFLISGKLDEVAGGIRRVAEATDATRREIAATRPVPPDKIMPGLTAKEPPRIP